MNSKIGIIILNYKTPLDVIKCIDSIDKNTVYKNYLIYVVDNYSKDDSVKIISEAVKEDRIKILSAEKNGGYSYGNNIGAKEAINDGCDKLLFINPDVVVKKNSIENLACVLDNNPQVAVVGPKVYDKNNNVVVYAKQGITFKQYLFLRKPFSILDGKNTIKTIHKNVDLNNGTVIFDGMVSGCCFMVRTSVFREIGLFDENMFLYYEEDALWSRFSERGFLCAIEPKAEVVHEHSASIGDTASVFSRRCEEVSALYYLRVYRGLSGWKLSFGIAFSKLLFLIVSKKRKQNYKEQYEILKKELYKLKHIEKR